jgi:RpiB/LacA/LacB family sugar-phosphate isomerase
LILELLFAEAVTEYNDCKQTSESTRALCWMKEIASLARQHNDANIISIPARYTSIPAVEMVETFINTAFEGGRHQNRVKKIAC